MNMLGLIGGTTWESTIIYYQRLNELMQQKFKGVHSAPVILYSVEFNHVLNLMKQNQWDTLAQEFSHIAQSLEKIGAKALLICTNTIHKIADQIQKSISIPLIHIIDATGIAIQNRHFKTVGLLGTRTTTEDPFFLNHLKDRFNIETIVPEAKDRQYLDDVIFKELAIGRLNSPSKHECFRMIEEMQSKGAQGIVLGCTELPLLLSCQEIPLPVFDTLDIHINAAFDFLIL